LALAAAAAAARVIIGGGAAAVSRVLSLLRDDVYASKVNFVVSHFFVLGEMTTQGTHHHLNVPAAVYQVSSLPLFISIHE
jgi:hypothetical protein